MFDCTPVVLPQGCVVRESARPADMRPPDYDDAFDATTLFYDVVALPAPRECLLFVGPPFLNLLPEFFRSHLDGRHLPTVWSSYYARDRCCDVWVQAWKGGDATFDTPFGSYRLSPQSAANHLYAGRRVLYTLSKDNEINWIVDWIRFHQINHGADAVLLYDNDSSRYTGEALESILRERFRQLEIHVVRWPYKYGPQGVSADSGWDSDFCQAGAFQDARFRFLARASSVLNCDVDELVVGRSGGSVFEAAERSPDGYVTFAGRWISNATPAREPADGSGFRHGEFVLADRNDSLPCPMKWCVVPRRCAVDVHWNTHAVTGKDSQAAFTRAFSYRHFRSISTSWKYRRYWPQDVGQDHRVDTALMRSLARADLLPRRLPGSRHAAIWSAMLRQLRQWAHPDLYQN